MDATELNSQFHKWLNNSTSLVIQYVVVTFFLFFLLFVWKRTSAEYARIQQKYPDNKQIKREIFYSMIFLLMLGTSVTLVVWLNKHGYTRAYKPIDKYGWGYYYASFFLMLLVHDAYFYWTHRLMHHQAIFKHVHKLHHEFTNPTPFTSYAVHPFEGMVQLGILFVIVFTIPHHSSIVTIFFGYSFLVNIVGHMGYEFLPKWFVHHRVFKWINTSVHHNLHHSNLKANYGYYFNFWDVIMKTEHRKYKEHFEAVANRRAERKSLSKPLEQELAIQDTIS
ncbi:sterol desaturase family protein [Mucilaginibacter sp. dw_454]|uniref:sterol desaturase family protein n=1 Tax=Mucilaginibacter sp. dw_454 TaxID=2720079 RepID=UPI001BD4886D|nr:sterol desaturase family protein [Mucilaginibacter sp. dw_454]